MNNFNRLKSPDAAHYLGLTESTISKWRMSGRGPVYIKAGARVLYDRTDLDSWLETNKRQNTAQAPVTAIRAAPKGTSTAKAS